MSTKTDIANLALSYLGDAFITTADLTTPSTVHAQLIANVLDQTLDDFVAEHDWDFAMVWSSVLPAIPDVASPDYDFYFDLPDGALHAAPLPDPYCLLVRATSHDDTEEPWAVEGRRLGMRFSNTVQLWYRSRPLISAWTPAAVTAVSYLIASKVSYAITESESREQAMKRLAELEMRRARSQDSFQRPARATKTRSLINVRLE